MTITLQLTTIGSRFQLDVEPAALPEAAGGLALILHLHDGPLAVTFTAAEAREVARAIEEEVTADAS